MTTKLIPHRYFWIILLALLTACGQATPLATEASTVAPFAWTAVALTQTAMPTTTLPLSTFTPTMLPTSTTTPTLIPTMPSPPIITPDAIQVERWKEYQTELAKVLFSYDPAYPQSHYGPDEYKDALCEWDILGRSGQKVYLWAICASPDLLKTPRKPVVIHLESDGSIREVKVAEEGTDSRTQLATYDLHLFPIEIQAKLCSYYLMFDVPQCNDIVPDYTPLNYNQEKVYYCHFLNIEKAIEMNLR